MGQPADSRNISFCLPKLQLSVVALYAYALEWHPWTFLLSK